ncbi:MAG: chromosomal replication initiator DnaA [Sphingomonadaceae bacterium]
MSQLALPLDWPVADEESDFIVSPANSAAFEHLRHWATWPVMATILTGPRKSGRSLLGRIFARKTGGRLFDDARAHDEEMLFHAWNEAQAARRPLLVVADAPPPVWRPALPDLASRLAATPHVAIAEPDDALFEALILKCLADRGLSVSPDLAKFLVPRTQRSYLSVQRIIETLDRAALASRRPLSMAMARRVLAAEKLI